MSCSARPLPTSRGSRCVPPPPGTSPERDFRLAELRAFHGDPDGAGHRRLAAAAERKAVDGRDHRLAEILDEIEHLLPEAAGLLGLDRGTLRELADVGAGDESLVAGARQDDAAHRGIVARVLEGLSQVRPGRRVQGIEDLRAIDGDVGDAALLLVEDVRERQARRFAAVHDGISCLRIGGEPAVAGEEPPARPCSHEGAKPGDGLADDQILHLIGAFV